MAVMTSSAPAPPRNLTTVVPPSRPISAESHQVAIDASHLSFYYGAKQALFDISAQLPARLVTAFIGPSGCGKSTFLRTLNRMNDVIPGSRVVGKVTVDGRDIYGSGVDPVASPLAPRARRSHVTARKPASASADASPAASAALDIAPFTMTTTGPSPVSS